MSEQPEIIAVWDSRSEFASETAVPIAGPDPVVKEVVAWANENLGGPGFCRRVCRVEFYYEAGLPRASVTRFAEDADGDVIITRDPMTGKYGVTLADPVVVDIPALPPAHLTGGRR